MGRQLEAWCYLVNRIINHRSRFELHKQIWDYYGMLEEGCDKLEQEASQEIERVHLNKPGLESELSLDLSHRWGN